MKPISTKHTLLGIVVACLLAVPATINAQPTAHYAPGSEGLNAATLPPPGLYLRDYNLFYYADKYNNASGDSTGVKAFIYAQVPRLLWISELELLGGNIGLDALVPLQYKYIQGVDQTFGVADPFLETTWSKHTKQFDFALGFGVWFPTENYSSQDPTWAGSGFWDYMFTAGATWYMDKDKTWSLSALNRYELNSQQAQTGITPGQAYTVEGGIGYAVSKTVSLGVMSYYQQQVNTDVGTRSTKERDRVAAIGPEITAFWPSATLGLSFRYAYEFLAESRLQGHTFTLTLTKRF